MLSGVGCGPRVDPEKSFLLATATTGGTFYPVGVAIATLATRELGPEHGYHFNAITSSGSAENISLLLGDEVDLAIVQSLFGTMAWQGTGLYDGRPIRSLRALSVLWENVEQIVVYRRHAPTGTVDDLAGMHGLRLSIGDRWSGVEVSARTLLAALGHDAYHDFRIANLGFGPSSEALQNRRIAGMFIAGGIPTGAITQAFATIGGDQLTLLAFAPEHIERIRARHPAWTAYTIPAGTYPGQTAPVTTLAQPNLLVTRAGLDAEAVYLLLRTVYGRIDFLQAAHRAAREMSLERALDGLPLPLHPGAVRFYREQGLPIPAELLPPEVAR
jgi:TRAP transporter TAXI family solute receptor